MRQLPLYILILVIGRLVSAQAADLNEELLSATRKGDVEAVKALLAKGADVNARTAHGATPLFYACDRGNAEMVKILLGAGADMKAREPNFNSMPIAFAVSRDHAEVVKLLIEKMPEIRDAAMNEAVRWSRTKTAAALLAAWSFPAERLTSWLTTAEDNDCEEIVELLKKAGARPKPESKP